jgi:hypothetical protein
MADMSMVPRNSTEQPDKPELGDGRADGIKKKKVVMFLILGVVGIAAVSATWSPTSWSENGHPWAAAPLPPPPPPPLTMDGAPPMRPGPNFGFVVATPPPPPPFGSRIADSAKFATELPGLLWTHKHQLLPDFG